MEYSEEFNEQQFYTSFLFLYSYQQCCSSINRNSRPGVLQCSNAAKNIPADIQAREVEVDAASDSVRIKWTTDAPGYTEQHTTQLSMETLRKLNYDYDAYMHDDQTLYELINQLRTDGLAFITNVPGIKESLATIATRIGPVKDTFYGYTWDVPAATNAAYTSHDLGFHTDLLYFQQPPHVQLLHCVQSASSGGASVFADAYKAAVDLFQADVDAFNTLATIPVNYHYNHPDSNVYCTTKPVIDLRPLRIGDTIYTHVQDYMKDWQESNVQKGESKSMEALLVDCMDKINWGPPFLALFSNHEDPGQLGQLGRPALEVLNSKVDRWHQAALKFNALLQRPEYMCERFMQQVRWSKKHERLQTASPIETYPDQSCEAESPLPEIQLAETDCNSTTGQTIETSTISTDVQGGLDPVAVDSDLGWLDMMAPIWQSTDVCLDAQVDASDMWDSTMACGVSTVPESHYDVLAMPGPGAWQTPVHLPTMLIEHWFRYVCPMRSTFDSEVNYNRQLAQNSWTKSEAVFYTMQAMSAACLVGSMPQLSESLPSLRAQATAAIERGISQVRTLQLSTVAVDLVFAVFALGTSLHWTTPSLSEHPWLELARELLFTWRVYVSALDAQLHAYFCQALTYWEMLLAVVGRGSIPAKVEGKRRQYQSRLRQAMHLLDDSDDTAFHEPLSYSPIHNVPGTRPNSWCGVSNEVIDVFGQVLALCRSVCYHDEDKNALTVASTSNALCDISLAHQLQRELLAMDFDSLILMEEVHGFSVQTRDDNTPISHLLQTADAYRQAALLQLHLTFHDLARTPQEAHGGSIIPDTLPVGPVEVAVGNGQSHPQFIHSLALQLVNTLKQIPAESGSSYRDGSRHNASDDEQRQNAGRVRKFYSRLIWSFQFVLSVLLIASIFIAVREVVAGQHEVTGTVEFSFSAYLAAYVGVLLFFLAGLLPDPEGLWSPDAAHCCAWVTGALAEIVIAAVFYSVKPSMQVSEGFVDTLIALGLSRIAIFVLMAAALITRESKLRPTKPEAAPEERQSLLESGNGSSNDYGSVPAHKPVDQARRTQVSGTGWLDYFAGFRVLVPYLWPKDSPLYQFVVVVCLVLLVGQRSVNFLAPMQLGVLVDALGEGRLPYKKIILYIVFRALQGNQGPLSAARAVLWIPVSQSLFRRLSVAAFEHVLGLSLDFHLNKKLGEVTSALSRGASINTFLESFCFQVVPMLLDIFVAGIIFFVTYDAFYTIIIFFIMWSYIFLTIYVAKYRGKLRRDMATKTREMEAIKTDAILAYETVQHNCAISRETEKFKEHVTVFQNAERLVQWSLNGLNLTQSSIFTLGTALLVVVSAYKISIGEQTVGQFVTLINYFALLQGPLNFFGTYYTMLQNNLIEAERLLDLFKETSGVVEKPDAVSLPSPRGEVRFNDVKFSYRNSKGEPVINGMNFTVAPGTKTAIVGESGGGKSTCLKLLFRFYDVTDGSITIDGHDLKDLTLESVRKNIGVVPQDTVLFNATIMSNLLYARPEASEAEVYDACRAANIHEHILNFPDGYETKVGERGLKLSGGERQRVAIARAILKDARILLLDEATASLDSHTERQIQDALEHVTAGRTTITIAHRLSTITTSDQIIVVHKGQIVERGTHDELLALQGRYHAMWEKQTTTEKKAKEGTETQDESSETTI
ncbi:hypothetical protein G7Z17_g709 [Cylindrodendrum hubeiense]|uniref:Uncharacterized protein n=1 Tax=Cylindrodendrum hubeiense TaxID=595255 RepID=A0A9P5LMS8_9HYPO|nr:hypothetical protein G7Z17_g709 [Cylindrodendrum hubeiense]